MPSFLQARHKILSINKLQRAIKRHRAAGKRIVFTNGCFDLVHAGHVTLLEKARRLGDVLIVASNSDRSMHSLKGPSRPVSAQQDRALVLAGLGSVDYVVIFNEPTPEKVIREIVPDVLVKGSDWGRGAIVGSDTVKAAGGKVVRLPLLKGRSTTGLIDRIKSGRSVLSRKKRS